MKVVPNHQLGLSESCSCLALYSGIEQAIDYKKIYDYFFLLAKRYDCVITHSGATGKGYPEEMKKVSLIEKRLEKNKFASLTGLDVYSVVFEGNIYYDWQYYASIASSPTSKTKELLICFDEKYNFIEKGIIHKIILELNDFFKIEYGIAYTRRYDQGPHYYASGVIQGLDQDSPEAEQIAIWFRAILNRRFFNRHVLRDVYPINILNKNQLQAKVAANGLAKLWGDSSLQEWIIANKFGTLTQLTEELWMWQVSEKREYIAQELCNKGLLLYCLPEG